MNATAAPTTIEIPGANADELIGTVTFTESSDPITENHTSYAADHRTYRVLPGTYEARLTRGGDKATMAFVVFTVDIEITNETLYSGIGGRNYHTDSDDTVRTSTKTHSIYAFVAARVAGENAPTLAGGAFRLNPDWAVIATHETLPALPWEKQDRHHTSREFAKLA